MNTWKRLAIAVLLVALSAADLVLTRYGLNRFGGVELNWLLANHLDSVWLLAAKTVGVAAIAVIVAVKGRPTWLLGMFYAVTAFYATVVAWNGVQIVVLSL